MSFVTLDAHNLGVTIGAPMVPLVGLVLLIVGLVELTRSQKQQPPAPPGYPGQTPHTASLDRRIPSHRPPTDTKRHPDTHPMRRSRAERRTHRRPVIFHRHGRNPEAPA